MPLNISLNAENPEELRMWILVLAAMYSASSPQDADLGRDIESMRCAPPNAAPAPTEPVDPSELDADGRQWDERIDSGNRAKKADGRWMRRRNLEDDYYNRVLAELTGGAKSYTPPAQEPPPVATPSFGASVPAVPQGSIFGAPMQEVAKAWTHDALTLELTNRVMAGTLGAKQVNLELGALGAATINGIPADKLADFAAKFGL